MMEKSKQPFGFFDTGHPGTYVLESLNMKTSWEYIYQNRDILLKVDQYGPVSAQAYPPEDIMVFKREKDDRYSKWLVWLQCESLNHGQPFTNFYRPVTEGSPDREPENLKIIFYPHKAAYSFSMGQLLIETVFFVPRHGSEIIMRFSLKNQGKNELNIKMISTLLPFINPALLAPWDKPEWYVKTGVRLEDRLVFWSDLYDSGAVYENRRHVMLETNAEHLKSAEISLERFCGPGDFYRPEGVWKKRLRISPEELGDNGKSDEGNQIYGYPSVYASDYQLVLSGGEKTEIVQRLAMAPPQTGYMPEGGAFTRHSANWFDGALFQKEEEQQRAFYNKLFGIRRIKTGDGFFDYYVNSWLPLQMYWTASLDRGWPTGMRGARDCANDFMGEVYLDPEWARQVLLLVLECERSDGWIPRQVSTRGRRGKHDLREYVDGGVFMIEFLYEYLCVTGDKEVLEARLKWLDSETESTVLEHCLRIMEYYLDEKNIGEHGLCKIRGGDWLDPVNRAGQKGVGESVMVTCQAVMAITYMLRILDWTGYEYPESQIWKEQQQRFSEQVRSCAFNEEGFFNGLFTDRRECIFSNHDPDGVSRPYACANAYAVISGIADEQQREGVQRAYERLREGDGYRLFYPPLGEKRIKLLGRLGSGDSFTGLFENGASYNHGSAGFLGRSLAVMGAAEDLFRTLEYMLPYHPDLHRPEEALTPPYAIVNCYQKVPLFQNRGGMTFLTGSVAMALRMVYNWLFGIRPGLDYLVLDPCISKRLGETAVDFTIRNRQIHLVFKRTGRMRCILNGEEYTGREYLEAERRMAFAISFDRLKERNEIMVEYGECSANME